MFFVGNNIDFFSNNISLDKNDNNGHLICIEMAGTE